MLRSSFVCLPVHVILLCFACRARAHARPALSPFRLCFANENHPKIEQNGSKMAPKIDRFEPFSFGGSLRTLFYCFLMHFAAFLLENTRRLLKSLILITFLQNHF